jgi:hypothetical protein
MLRYDQNSNTELEPKLYEPQNGTAVRFQQVPLPGGYPWFRGYNRDWTIRSGFKPRPQPGNPGTDGNTTYNAAITECKAPLF